MNRFTNPKSADLRTGRSRLRRRPLAVVVVAMLAAVLPSVNSSPVSALSQNEVITTVLYDGTAGWAGTDPLVPAGSAPEAHTPGLDSGPNNLVVRTHDQFAVRVDWNVNEDAATNVVLEVVLPAEAQWNPDQTGMFSGCNPATSSFPDPQTLLCDLGDQAEGSNGVIRPVALLNEALDNSTFDVTATLTTDDDAAGVSDGLDQELTVSESPIVDYIKAAPVTSAVLDNGAETGYVLLFPLTFTDGSQGTPIRGAGPINDAVQVELFDHMWSLTPSARLADAAEMTAAGFAGAPCGNYAQSDPFVAGNGNWVCGAEAIGAGGYPVVPITVSGFASRPFPATLADGTANSGNPQISSGQIAVWLSEAEVDAAIADSSNQSNVSALLENAIAVDDGSVAIASPADINEAPGNGTSGPSTRGATGNNNAEVEFGSNATAGGGPGATAGHFIQWWNGDFMLAEGERNGGVTVRDNAVAAFGGTGGFPSGFAGNTESYYGSLGIAENRVEVARGQNLTLFAQFEGASRTPGGTTDPLSGCVAFDTAHYTLIEHGDIQLLDLSPAQVVGVRMAASPYQAQSISTITASDGPLVHVEAGEQARILRRYAGLDYGIGGETFPYVVEFTNAAVPTYNGTQTGIGHDGLTCNDTDAGSLGWVPATGDVSVFDADNDGAYELLTRARVRAIGPVDWHNEWATGGAGQSINLFFQTQVKTDLVVNADDQELFAFASHAIGEWVDGAPPAGSCRPHSTGLWGHAQNNDNGTPNDTTDDFLVFPPDGNDADTTTGWCNNRFEDTGADSFDVSDGVDWDESSYTWANGTSMTMASGTMVYISEVQPRVAKSNVDGLSDIKDNGQTVQFTITPSAVGGEVEALTDVVVVDNLPAHYEFVSFVDLPDVPFVNESSGQNIRIRYSDAVPDTDPALPAGLAGGWPASTGLDASFTIEVRVTGAIANPDSATVLANTAQINSGGTGPWDAVDGSFSDPPIVNAQNHRGSAFAYMPLPADEGVILKAVDTLEGPCVLSPESDPPPVGWGDRCSMIGFEDPMSFVLSLTNEGNTAFTDIEIVDVFPHDGDEVEPPSATNVVDPFGSPSTLGDGRAPGTDAEGTLGFVSMTPVSGVPAGATVTTWVSGDAPGTISRDPVVSVAMGATTWCDTAGGAVQSGSGTCPATNDDVTATYTLVDVADGAIGLRPDDTLEMRLTLSPQGHECDDVWTNTFGLRVPEILLPVRSNDVSIMVNCEFDLALRKTVDPAFVPGADWITPGTTTVDFQIEVFNQGDPIENFDVTDYIDTAVFNFEVGNNANGDTTAGSSGGPVLPFTWDATTDPAAPVASVVGALAPGESVFIPVTLTIVGVSSDMSNFAEISYFDSDGDPSNGDSDPDNPNNPTTAPDGLVDEDSTPDGDNTDVLIDDEINETDPSVDEDDHDVAQIPVFDLSLVKTVAGPVDMSTAPPTASFTIEVANEGTETVFFVDVAEYMPAGLSLNEAATDAGLPVGVTRVGDVYTIAGPILPGTALSFDIEVDVTDVALAPYRNAAEISAFDDDADDQTPNGPFTIDIDSTPDGVDDDDVINHNVTNYDPDNDGNLGEVTPGDEDDHDIEELVFPIFDLALRKTVDPSTEFPVTIGSEVTFLVEVINQGTTNATDVSLIDYVDTAMWDGFDAAANVPGTTGGDAELGYSWAAAGTDGVVSIVGALAPGQTVTVPVTLTIAAGADLEMLSNTAEISGGTPTDDGGNTIIGVDGEPIPDTDSTPDTTDDDALIDDEVSLTPDTGDEDDHDIALVMAPTYSLGNQVWIDTNNDGVLDSGETPVEGVVMLLFTDIDGDGEPDDTNGDGVIDEDDAIATDTTDGDGAYLFEDLDAGDYIVGVAAENFEPGGVLFNTTPSTPVSTDANDDVDDNNDGSIGPDGLVVSTPISLGGAEPTSEAGLDNDTTNADSLSNLTIDFGFWQPLFDLALRKTVASNTSGISIGDSVTYDVEVFNQGDVAATDVTVIDYLPASQELNDADWTAGAGNTATIDLDGSIEPGESVTVQITVTVLSAGDAPNSAEITDATPVDENGDPIATPAGDPIADIDSTPDTDNDDPVVDDVIDDSGDDEDDHDIATVTVNRPVPSTLAFTGSDSNALANVAAMLLAGGIAIVMIARRRRQMTI